MFSEKEIRLAQFDIENALEVYNAAEELFKTKHYNSALNRSYYSIFHLMCARLVLDGLGFGRHSAVISKFRELYLNKDFAGDTKDKLNEVMKESEILRNQSDYERGFHADENITKKALEDVKYFNDTILDYINNLINKE